MNLAATAARSSREDSGGTSRDWYDAFVQVLSNIGWLVEGDANGPDRLEEQVFDDDGDDADALDVEPAPGLDSSDPLVELVEQAEQTKPSVLTPTLKGLQGNPKEIRGTLRDRSNVAGPCMKRGQGWRKCLYLIEKKVEASTGIEPVCTDLQSVHPGAV